MQQHTVVGLFDDRSDAQSAMEELVENGFMQEDIDLSNRRLAGDADSDMDSDMDTSTGSNAGMGDKISNFFNSLFGDDETTSRNYTNAAGDAEAILTIHTDSVERAEEAREIMDDYGAIDVEERGAAYAQGSSRAEGGMSSRATGDRDTGYDTNVDRKVPVVEERLDVGKREVESGGARIRSRVVERPVEETVRLREEHVTVNRRPVDREVTAADRQNFQPGEMVITERSEVPIVGKEARVVEEVEVGKEVTEREETIRDTIRRTEVDVDEIDNPTSGKAKGAKF